jgi:hypothetical protein
MSSFLDPKKSSDHFRMNPPATNPGETAEAAIPVDGFGQVISLLQVADPAFRESLIGRIAAKDPVLARQIRAALSRGN